VETKISKTLTSIAEAERRGIREETTDQDPAHAWVKTEMEKAKADLIGLQARASVMAGALKTLENRAHRLAGESVFQQDLLRSAKPMRRITFFIIGSAKKPASRMLLTNGKSSMPRSRRHRWRRWCRRVCRQASNCSWSW